MHVVYVLLITYGMFFFFLLLLYSLIEMKNLLPWQLCSQSCHISEVWQANENINFEEVTEAVNVY